MCAVLLDGLCSTRLIDFSPSLPDSRRSVLPGIHPPVGHGNWWKNEQILVALASR
ncbi:hypothetical protein AVEN_31693-1, partial [Araneus ventricosus]